MSAVSRVLDRYPFGRVVAVLCFLALPGVCAFAVHWLDEWLDRREYERQRRVR